MSPSASSTGHHPTLLTAGARGCWCTCTCGWTSGLFRAVVGAHIAFGKHLVSERTAR